MADLAECQLETRDKAEQPFFSNQFLLKSLVDLTASTDLDLQEKVFLYDRLILHCFNKMYFDALCVVGEHTTSIFD